MVTRAEGQAPVTRLRYYMAQRGERNYTIAGHCGIHPYTLSQYATGQRDIAPHHLLALSDYLNVAPENLTGLMDVVL